jgi:hypothetical protein
MRSNGNQRSRSTDILVKLLLYVDKALKGVGIELDISDDGRNHEGSNTLGGFFDAKVDRGRRHGN